MLTTSHLAATLFISNWTSLEGAEVLVALAGGVAIDADHFFVNKKWLDDIKLFLRHGKVTHGEVVQHSWLQEPLFGLISGVAIGLGLQYFIGVHWGIFPMFQLVHIIMDAMMKYEHKPLVPFARWNYRGFIPSSTYVELLVSVVLLLGIILGKI